MSLRAKVGLELGVLATLTPIFLFIFPDRPITVDASLALFSLILIGLTARYTRRVVWSAWPPPDPKPTLKCLKITAAFTLPSVLAFAVIGGWIAHLQDDAIGPRLLNWKMAPAFVCYLPWALAQQTQFQFYLLGRLGILMPIRLAAVLTGIAYALVHLPDPWITGVTIPAGLVWCLLYTRFRLIWPLALSHGLMGTAFYYWVYGLDIFAAWFKAMQKL
jgi:membrane protease YdiL (CAAX protease family)